MFYLLSRKCSFRFLHSFPIDFSRFLCKFSVNLLERNLRSIKQHHTAKLQNDVPPLLLKNSEKQKRNLLLSHQRLQLLKIILLFQSKVICLGMGQFVFVTVCLYNKNLTSQLARKQEFSKCHDAQIRMNQKQSPKNERTETIGVGRFIGWKNIALTLKWVFKCTITFFGRRKIWSLLSDFVQQLHRRKSDVQNFYFFWLTLLVFLQIWFWMKNT